MTVVILTFSFFSFDFENYLLTCFFLCLIEAQWTLLYFSKSI